MNTDKLLILKHIRKRVSIRLEPSKIYIGNKIQDISDKKAHFLFTFTQTLIKERETAEREFLKSYELLKNI